MKTISILGSTGSIGTQTLEIVKNQGFSIAGLAANINYELLEKQARAYNPRFVCIYSTEYQSVLKERLKDTNIQVLTGMDGLCQIATMPEVEVVVTALTGMIGLQPTIQAIEKKKNIALANKETLVTGGKLVMNLAEEHGVKILPVDSEHSAIFQCMQGNAQNPLQRIILTASGGPFFGKNKKELENITVEQALRHPNWSMGKKITIDSATMMNKGLELIEAVWLFDLTPEDVDIVVHRESVIHSAVEYTDHSVIAQLGVPDMKIPIQYALTYPRRFSCDVKKLSLTDYGSLTFAKPDVETFCCLKACQEAIAKGGLYPAIVNGANEKAVELFLEEKISFLDIGKYVYASLSLSIEKENYTLEDIKSADQMAREFVLKQANANSN